METPFTSSEPDGAAPARPFVDAINQSVAEIVDGKRTEALLFTGNRHYAVPAGLINDVVLSPVDKLIWLIICQHSGGVGEGADFPSYTQIQRDANLGSSTTVARSLHVLRLTRWLSLCARVRDDHGRFRGNVYALHDEPLALNDALCLDQGYLRHLEDSISHDHARIARAAKRVASDLDHDIETQRDILTREPAHDRRIRRRRQRGKSSKARPEALERTVSPSVPDASAPLGDNHRRYQVKTGSRSSNNIITTTTPRRVGARATRELNFPQRLNDNQRALAARYLAIVPDDLQQLVLDELIARLEAERHGAEPVWDVLRYLHRLCSRARDGEFEPNLAFTRQTVPPRAKPSRPQGAESMAATEAPRDESEVQLWRQRFDELGEALGVPPSEKDD